ncbi:MAG: hypothetical protein LBU12_09275 [Deltaproteobacteria bacterium]|jgi:hypothetical protein|nr:hypothetical protein [Deltaproteobacteria bacterium]
MHAGPYGLSTLIFYANIDYHFIDKGKDRSIALLSLSQYPIEFIAYIASQLKNDNFFIYNIYPAHKLQKVFENYFNDYRDEIEQAPSDHALAYIPVNKRRYFDLKSKHSETLSYIENITRQKN